MYPAKLELTHQFVGIFALIAEPSSATQAVSANQRYLTHFAVADFLNQRLAGGGMTALESCGDLDVLLLGQFAGAEQPV